MKSKKSGVLTLFVVICYLLSVLAACDNIADTPEIQPENGFENGYGKIRVSFAGEESAARTVLPSKVFDKYTYIFTKTGETDGVEKKSDSDGFFILEIGSYTVAVQAYTGNEGSYTLMATGVSQQFSVGPNSNAPVEVRLSNFAVGTEGEFSYTITYPETFEEVTISLQKWPELYDVALAPVDVTQGNGKTQTLQLEAGSYMLTVLVRKSLLYTGISEAIQIRHSLSTVYLKNFTDNYLLGAIPVTNAEIIVIAPVKGATPETSASGSPAGGKFTVGPVSWSPEHDFFLGSTVYTATLTLTANIGSTLTGMGSASINGQDASMTDNTGTSVTLSLAFPPTENRTVTGITIKTQPDNLTYTHGDQLDLTGLAITLSYDDDTAEDVAAAGFSAKNITANPAHGNNVVRSTHNGKPVKITYGGLPALATDNLIVRPKVITFTIDPIPTQYDNAVFPITPAIVVKDGKTTLTLNTDYTVSYTGNNSSGIATVTISGMGNYAGSSGSATFIIPYTVIFNLNGGSGNGTTLYPETVLPDSSITLPIGIELYRYGYALGGWNTKADGTGTNYYPGASYTPSQGGSGGSITLYANWISTVTFNINGGTGTTPALQMVSAGSGINLPSGSEITKTGYTFGGWNTKADGTGTNYNASAFYTPTTSVNTTNITLYARWVYTVTFNINGGSGTAPALQMLLPSYNIVLPGENGMTKTGAVFGGWNTRADGTGTNYIAGVYYTPTGNVTLYANWVVPYTVTFDTNGGSGTAPAPQEILPGSGITLPGGNGLSKTGYVLGGWNTKSDGTGTNYIAGVSYYTPTQNVTLYANWVVPYTVTFNANGGSGTAPAPQDVPPGYSITLPGGNGLSRTGYVIGGWNTKSDGTGTNYSMGAYYTPTGNVTLYANWVVPYTVTFNANGGSGTTPAPQDVPPGYGITLPGGDGLYRYGYNFGGWNTKADGTGTNYSVGASYTPTQNVTLYASWIVAPMVTFSINGGSGTAPGTLQVPLGSSGITLPGGDGLTRPGYTFMGWNTNSSGTGANYSAGSSFTTTQNVTLYANWALPYTVTFNLNGANSINTAPASQTVPASSIITLPNAGGFSRTGYTFRGWSTNASGTGTTYSAGSSYTTPASNITLYAKWILNVTITYSINDGTGTTPGSQTIPSDSSFDTPSGAGFSRTGYTFMGWNTWHNGTGTNYNADSSYAAPAQNLALYARWIPN
jgi:uncharacterized repeat protein (TIGR02543 family)